MTAAHLHPERQLVGSALAHPETLDLDHDPGDFADARLGALWRLMAAMRHRGEAVTAATVASALGQIPEPERRGITPVEIAELYGQAPITPLEGRQARDAVRDAAVRRRLESAATRIVQLARSGEIPPAELVEIARSEVDASYRHVAGVTMLGDLIDAKLDALEQPAVATPTPWPDLNRLTKGWRPGALYIVAARPGLGKTIVGLQAAIDLASSGYVAFSSLEMSEGEIVGRVIAQTAEVALGRLDGTSDDPATSLSARDWERIAAQRGTWNDMRLALDCRPGVSAQQVRSHARSVARKGPLAGVVVDYMQLMQAASGDRRPRHEVVADFSRSLKVLAMELNVPVIALSQLNRGSLNREDKRPTLGDLRESGSIEQDADVVILLHSEGDHPTDLEMIVAKNRHGVTGPVYLTREGHYARMRPRKPAAWTPSGNH